MDTDKTEDLSLKEFTQALEEQGQTPTEDIRFDFEGDDVVFEDRREYSHED